MSEDDSSADHLLGVARNGGRRGSRTGRQAGSSVRQACGNAAVSLSEIDTISNAIYIAKCASMCGCMREYVMDLRFDRDLIDYSYR